MHEVGNPKQPIKGQSVSQYFLSRQRVHRLYVFFVADFCLMSGVLKEQMDVVVIIWTFDKIL